MKYEIYISKNKLLSIEYILVKQSIKIINIYASNYFSHEI